MNADTKAMIEAGERRLRDRRAPVQPDPMLELVNEITADRDRLRREVRRLNALVTHQARILDRSEPARVTYAESQGSAS